MRELVDNKQYRDFLNEVLQKIERARYESFKTTNKYNILLNYEIGKVIIERQKLYGWGKSIVEQLSKDITKQYDGVKGYSSQNLWHMRQFFNEYKEYPQLLLLACSVPWSHNLLIMHKIKDYREREYYLEATEKMAWSRAVLLNQIKADAYNYQLNNPKQNNFEKALPEHLSEQADEAIKSVYNLDFLGISRPVRERRLENLLIEKIRDFLMELGYGFCFIGNQYKITLGTKDYFIDLLFYHRILKCMVAIELKAVEFEPEFAAKMNFYLEILDKQLKQNDDNPSIGIVLCPQKDDLEVEYALRIINKPVGVAEYQLMKELPTKMKGKLPTVSELKEKLQNTIKEIEK